MNNCYYQNQSDPCNRQGVYQNNSFNPVSETKIIGARGPRGCPGQAATITIGTVTTGDTPSVTNVGTSTNAILNFVLPNDGTENTQAFASLYSDTAQTFNLATGYGNVDMTSSTIENMTFDDANNTVTVLESGLYQISYDITVTSGAGNGNIAILRNTIPVAGSIKGIVLDNSNISSDVVLPLNEGDVLSLGVITTTGTIELTTTPITNATMTITKIN